MRHDHHQVQVAALVGLAPRVRAEQPDLFRLKLLHEAAGDFAKQIWADGFHVASLPAPLVMARSEMRTPGVDGRESVDPKTSKQQLNRPPSPGLRRVNCWMRILAARRGISDFRFQIS
jgi:hypothetical protein